MHELAVASFLVLHSSAIVVKNFQHVTNLHCQKFSAVALVRSSKVRALLMGMKGQAGRIRLEGGELVMAAACVSMRQPIHSVLPGG